MGEVTDEEFEDMEDVEFVEEYCDDHDMEVNESDEIEHEVETMPILYEDSNHSNNVVNDKYDNNSENTNVACEKEVFKDDMRSLVQGEEEVRPVQKGDAKS